MDIYEKVKKVWDEHQEEFEKRIGQWAGHLKRNSCIIKNNRQKFRAWKPLEVYVSYSLTKMGEFSIRFCGQEVGRLRIRNGEKHLIVSDKNINHNKKWFCLKGLEAGVYLWEGKDAGKFRKHFKDRLKRREPIGTGIGEHKLEWLFLREMAKRTKKNKLSNKLSKIQPVRIAGCPFQMPLPIKGSDGEPKKGDGHIDILARRRKNGRVVISVWELKDVGKLAEALKQVYIYSIALLLMLKSPSAQKWYEIFGFKRPIPQPLEMEAVIAVSASQKGKLLKAVEEARRQMQLEVEEGSVKLCACYYELIPSADALPSLRIDSFESLLA